MPYFGVLKAAPLAYLGLRSGKKCRPQCRNVSSVIASHMTGNSFGSAMGGLDGWPAYGFGTLDSLCGNVDVELPVGGTFCRVLQWRVLAGV